MREDSANEQMTTQLKKVLTSSVETKKLDPNEESKDSNPVSKQVRKIFQDNEESIINQEFETLQMQAFMDDPSLGDQPINR